MAFEVSSWFLEQLESRNSQPKRTFYIGTSDYSNWVIKYPKFKRTANDIRSVNISIELANEEKEFNNFYHYTYTIPNTCTLQVGFTHPTSGDELITLFTGFLKDVKYSGGNNKKTCTLRLKDRLWDFTERKVGDPNNVISIETITPSDIAWFLCTSYGGLDATQGSDNPDINYISFLAWAEQFSQDNVLATGRYSGKKVVDALNRLGKMTDSAIWIEGDGKLTFKRFTEPDSLDMTFSGDHFLGLEIDVKSLRLINKFYTYWEYEPTSNSWASGVFQIDSLSVNSFGLKEGYIRDETIWYCDSVSALNLSARKIALYNNPPKSFELTSTLYGITRQIGETVRIVDSFHNITEYSGWRLMEVDYDMNKAITQYNLDEATVQNAFYLDISTLDGDHLLL